MFSLLFSCGGVFATGNMTTGKVDGDVLLTGFFLCNRSHSHNNHVIDTCPFVKRSSLCCFVSVSLFLSLLYALIFSLDNFSWWETFLFFGDERRRSI